MIHSCTVQMHQHVAKDSKVCFHKWLFDDLVKLHWYIIRFVGPLVSTDQNLWDANLLPMAVLIYPVVGVHTSLSPTGTTAPLSVP